MASANVRPWGTGSPEPSTWPRLMGEPAEQDDEDQAGPADRWAASIRSRSAGSGAENVSRSPEAG